MTVLAIDIGGTSVRAARVAHAGIVARAAADTSADLSATVVALARALSADARIEAIGIGVPEYVEAGVVTSREVIAWDDDIVARLGEIAPVRVESDVRCGATAEWAAMPGTSLLYVSWGTGISSTLVLPDGTPWEGHRGRAIALGERRVGAATLERLASGRAVAHRYRDATGVPLTTREIAQRPADAVALELLGEAGRLLAEAVADLARALDPARVVVGGGVGTAETDAGRSFDATWELARVDIPLERARRGADAGLYGAAIVAASLVKEPA